MSPREEAVARIRELAETPEGARRYLNCRDLAHLIEIKTGDAPEWVDIDPGKMRRDVVELYTVDTHMDLYGSSAVMGLHEYNQIIEELEALC